MTLPGHLTTADEWAQLPEGEPQGIQDIRDALVIRERDTFLLTDEHGNIPRGNVQGLGLYRSDTRHLSTYSFHVQGGPPVVLLSTAELGFAMEQVLTNARMETPEGRIVQRGSVEFHRQRVIADVLEETVRVTNFNPFPVTLELWFDLDADFADIFEVRGQPRSRRGQMLPTIVREDTIVYSYIGLDQRRRETRVSFNPNPASISPSGARFALNLGRRETVVLQVVVAADHSRTPRRRNRFDAVAADYNAWMQGCARITTDNEFFNRVLERSFADLRMLLSETPNGERYPAAGTPWFDTLFGRDSCIVSLQFLPYRPDLARQTLKVLAAHQGVTRDPWRDEEPGKILHELRVDEMSASGELPYAPYYGSVDSTPLYLMLAAEYYNWTGDLRTLHSLQGAILAALGWIDVYGDIDHDDYVEYEKRSARGLVNQGWKDSWDAIMHAEGPLATPPITLVEVQGYVYAARRGIARVLSALGLREEAERQLHKAQALRRRFNRDFWLPQERYYALALDGDGRPCASIASNPGHALWTGIVRRAYAEDVVRRLLSNELFSGWGIRTLSTGNIRYNPIGYHNGTVWPHDNAICAMGFKVYGFEEEVNELATALFDAACTFPYYRLPELFGGQPRTAHGAPVPYPVACRPQAWAAGSFPMILQAMLGLRADAPNRQLRIVRPTLPYWLDHVQVRGLRVGRGYVDLRFFRRRGKTAVEVTDSAGGISVVQPGRWSHRSA